MPTFVLGLGPGLGSLDWIVTLLFKEGGAFSIDCI